MAESFYPHQCSFCMETFKDPRFLKGCNHSICLSCAEFQFSSQLSSLFASSSSPNNGYPLKKKEKDGKSMNSSQGKAEGSSQGIPITCYKCNKKTFIPLESSPEKELPKNHDLNELLQPTKDQCSNGKCSQEVTHGCIECKKMFCQKHKKYHDDLALDDHECLSVKEYKEKMGKGSDDYILEWFDKQFKTTQNSYTISSKKYIELKRELTKKYIENSTDSQSSQVDKEQPEKKRRRLKYSQQIAENQMYNSKATLTSYILENSNQTVVTYFVDCSIIIIIINPSEINNNNNPHQQYSSSQTTTYEWIKSKLRSRRSKNIQLKGKLSKIAGKDTLGKYDGGGFDNSSMQDAIFYCPCFLKNKPSSNKLYISDRWNHIIRSIRSISMNNNDEWNGKLEIEVGQPEEEGYSNGDRNTCKLRYPNGFDWDMNDNMYICNDPCICKVDCKSNQVSLVAGHATHKGYKDGNNDEARFDGLNRILCYQQNHHQFPPVVYACDCWNHCIRMIDITNGKTSTFVGEGKEKGDVDGTLQSARFNWPWNIVKDDEDDHILYVSDSYNHKIKMVDMKKGMVRTLVGDKSDKSILNGPRQMQIIDSFIYVACAGNGFKDCIVKIDKHSKQVTKIKFNDGEEVSGGMYGITYHELDQCFYISDDDNIYKLE